MRLFKTLSSQNLFKHAFIGCAFAWLTHLPAHGANSSQPGTCLQNLQSTSAQEMFQTFSKELNVLAIIDWEIDFEIPADHSFFVAYEKDRILTAERDQRLWADLREFEKRLSLASASEVSGFLDLILAHLYDDSVPLLWKRAFIVHLYSPLITAIAITGLHSRFQDNIQSFLFQWLPTEIIGSLNSRKWILKLAKIRGEIVPLHVSQMSTMFNLHEFWKPFFRFQLSEHHVEDSLSAEAAVAWHGALTAVESQIRGTLGRNDDKLIVYNLWLIMTRYAFQSKDFQHSDSVLRHYRSLQNSVSGTSIEKVAVASFLDAMGLFAYKKSDRSLVRFFIHELRALEKPEQNKYWQDKNLVPAKLISWIFRQLGDTLPDFLNLELERALQAQKTHRQMFGILRQFVASIELNLFYSRHAFIESHSNALRLIRMRLLELNEVPPEMIRELRDKIENLEKDLLLKSVIAWDRNQSNG